MILRQKSLDGVRDGTITLAFRRWRRPTVRTGGTLLTGAGQLEIESVEPIAIERITAGDARRAGYASRDALVAELNERADGDVYRIAFGALRADPRIELRATTPNESDLEDLRIRLDRIDERSDVGAWTRPVLELIRDNPGLRAAELCVLAGQPKLDFKTNVRKLKALGLTESLEVGYRLAPRGEAFLRSRR